MRLYCRICHIRVMFLVFMRYMKRFSLLNSLRNCFLSIIVILRKVWNQLLQYWPFTTDLKQQKQTLGGLNDCFFVFWFNSVLNGFKAWILVSETLPLAANTYSWLLCSSLGQNSTVNGTTVSSLESSYLVLSSGSCDILLVIFIVVVEAVAFRCGSHGAIIVVVPIIVS